MVNSILQFLQAFWPLSWIQLKRSYILCNWHASDPTFYHPLHTDFILYLLVAAIVGHLSFFLHQESPNTNNSLERAAQIYQQSTHDASVKQAVEEIFQLENLFKSSHIKHVLNVLKHSYVNHALLVEEATQAVLKNLLCMDFTIKFLFDEY